MTLKVDKTKLELKNEQIIDFYKADIKKFGNGAKINCKKKHLENGYTAFVVICK